MCLVLDYVRKYAYVWQLRAYLHAIGEGVQVVRYGIYKKSWGISIVDRATTKVRHMGDVLTTVVVEVSENTATRYRRKPR